MKHSIIMLLSMLLLINPSVINAQEAPECGQLKSILNAEIKADNGVCKTEIIRKNLEVTHKGSLLSTDTMELEFHIAFEKADNEWITIGEMALLEDEVNYVIDELRKGGIEISALHNHMMHEQPRIMFLHFQGAGELNQLSSSIKKAIESTAN